jgi:hypothetical protein
MEILPILKKARKELVKDERENVETGLCTLLLYLDWEEIDYYQHYLVKHLFTEFPQKFNRIGKRYGEGDIGKFSFNAKDYTSRFNWIDKRIEIETAKTK